MVKNLPVIQHGFDPWVRKIPLDKEMQIHSSILAWEITLKEDSGGLHSMGTQRVRHNLSSKQMGKVLGEWISSTWLKDS